MLERVDHLVYAAPDLEAAVAALAVSLGVEATAGGRHPDEGTRNALIALGPASYLEIVGPDTAARTPARPRWFGIDGLEKARLVTWAARAPDLDVVVAASRREDIGLGEVRSGARVRSDGTPLRWRFTDPHTVVEDGIVPFFIDWAESPHPATTAAPGCRLTALRAEHPDPEHVSGALRALGLALQVGRGSEPALIALLETPRGMIELR